MGYIFTGARRIFLYPDKHIYIKSFLLKDRIFRIEFKKSNLSFRGYIRCSTKLFDNKTLNDLFLAQEFDSRLRKSSFTHYCKRIKKERIAEVAKKLMTKKRHIRPPAKCRFGENSCLAEWYFAGLAGSRNDRSSPRHEFDLCSYPLLRSSRCDRNIIDSRELSWSVSLPGLSNKVWRCCA